MRRGRTGSGWWLETGGSLMLLAVLLAVSPDARCEWTVTSRNDLTRSGEVRVASTRNDAGYTLEIYRDSDNAVRSRFTLPDGLLAFAGGTCPTYQIDRGTPINRSVNAAPCLTNGSWSELVLGYVTDNHIASSSLLAVMNGINIVFRFKLENGDYRSTQFSLQGSKRALIEVFGENISISSN